jgi:hypothetical protein
MNLNVLPKAVSKYRCNYMYTVQINSSVSKSYMHTMYMYMYVRIRIFLVHLKVHDPRVFKMIFPYTCSNIPLSLVYGVYISQLIRYARVCSTYNQFSSRGTLLTDKLIKQGFLQSRLMSAFLKFYGRYNDLIHNYKLSLSHMLSDIFFIPIVRPQLTH